MRTRWLLALMGALIVVLIAARILRPADSGVVEIEQSFESIEVREMMNEIVQEQQSGGEGP